MVNKFISRLSSEELLFLRSYTGYNFKNINAILRNNWLYDEHSLLNEKIKAKYLKITNEIRKIINKFPSLDMDFYTYRGVELEVFKKFEIRSFRRFNFFKR